MSSVIRRPLMLTRLLLSCVHIQSLNEDRHPISNATASGFIRAEGESLFLYTCWHVVTGWEDPYGKVAPREPPTRRHFLRVSLQGADLAGQGATVIGGLQTVDIPLYEHKHGTLLPTWLQDEKDVPHLEINALGLRRPFWHDAIKLQLPTSIKISNLQQIDNSRIFGSRGGLLQVGDKVLVAGFPHGFSTVGMGQPTPVVLTRFVAGTKIDGRHQQFLLESIGAAGMSGGPVYIEANDELWLIGIYTGLIYPDYLRTHPEKATALGTVANLQFELLGNLPFVRPQLPDDKW